MEEFLEPPPHGERSMEGALRVILLCRGAPNAAMTASPTNFSTVPPAS